MPSENEIVDQPGDDQPELNTDQAIAAQAGETAVSPSTPVQSEPVFADEAVDEEVVEEEMDWDSWLLSSPEAEEPMPVPELVKAAKPQFFAAADEFADDEFAADEFADDDEFEDDEFADDEFDEEAEADDSEPNEETDVTMTELVAAEVVIVESFAETGELVVEAVEIVVETAVSEASSASEAEPEETLADVPAPAPVKAKAPLKRHPQGLTAKDVIRYFAACARCGYFLTGYRAAFGEDNFETAVSEEKDGWLTLSWGANLPLLVEKNYGTAVESNDLFFSNCCLECHRTLLYKGQPEGEEPATFRIELKPKKR